MKKIFAGFIIGAITIVLLTSSISLSSVSARSIAGLNTDIVSFGIQEHSDLAKLGITTLSGTAPYGKCDTKTIRITIDTAECSIHEIDDYVFLKIGNHKPFTEPGEPQLPMQTQIVKLPKNAEVIGVAISNEIYIEIENELNIVPVPQPVVWSEKVMPEIIPNVKVYGLDVYFPGRAISYDVGSDNEYKYVSIRFYPLQYLPVRKKALLITDAEIEVYYRDIGSLVHLSFQEASGEISTDAENIILTPQGLYEPAKSPENLHDGKGTPTEVVNTTWIYTNYDNASDPLYEGYKNSSITGWDNIAGYNYSLAKRIVNYLDDRTAHPSLKYVTSIVSFGIQAENIILTPPEFYEQAKSLENFHDGKGTATEVVNTSWVYTNYANASDPPYEGYKNSSITGWDNIAGYNYSLAKRIVNYLDDDTVHPNLKYVTIFGTARLVPPSYYVYITHSSPYNNWIPTDFFFASPEYDLVPNYMVGRLPVDSIEEAEHVVQKIKNWAENVSWDWFNNVYLVGGRPSYSHYYYGEMMTTDVINRNSFNGMNIKNLFKSDGSLTAANVTSALSGNTGMLYIISQGDGQCAYESYYFLLCADDLLSLSPNPKTPVVVSIACGNGAFDTNVYYDDFDTSFGEAVLLSEAAGIAYIGGARVTHGLPIFYLENGYLTITQESYMAGMLTNVFEAYHTGSNTLGEITRTAIRKFVSENDFSDKKNLVTLFEFVLLGDPALELPAQQPGYSNQQPVSTAVEPAGYVAETYGNIPWYNTNTSITIHTTTDSPTVYTKRIDTHANTVVERLENNTVGGAFNYTFTSPIETEYLVRTASEDGKEGWQYVRVVLPVHNLNTSENFASRDISIN